MQGWRNGVPMLASSGYVGVVEQERCVGCGICVEACPFGAIAERDGVAAVDREACMGCGVCVSHCAQEALSLVREPSKGEPLEIEALLSAVTESV
jgi:Pyruvate/2-oxoacid:ferredoxin oxidoreductase delta subunit